MHLDSDVVREYSCFRTSLSTSLATLTTPLCLPILKKSPPASTSPFPPPLVPFTHFPPFSSSFSPPFFSFLCSPLLVLSSSSSSAFFLTFVSSFSISFFFPTPLINTSSPTMEYRTPSWSASTCGVVWRGVAWCGVVWRCVVWCDKVLCGLK